MLSVSTDYAASTDDPSPFLRKIADAGFTHVHWCHHWCTDFIYSPAEIEQIGKWLSEYGLELLDLHGNTGPEKNWTAVEEYRRLAGVDLVKNRIEMTAELGGDAVVMHGADDANYEPLRRSLDALEVFATERSVRIALENGDFKALTRYLSEYDPAYVGICYDCGHANIGNAAADVVPLKDRIAVVHLHDNDGTADQHMIPFTGTVDWQQLAETLAQSSYRKCVNLELVKYGSGLEEDEPAFLAKAYEAGERISAMIAESSNSEDA